MKTAKMEIEVSHPDDCEPVAFRAPMIGEYFLTATGEIASCRMRFTDTERRLIVRKIQPPLPEMGPLEWTDVIANKTILRGAIWDAECSTGVFYVHRRGVTFFVGTDQHAVTFDELRERRWSYSNDEGTTFQKCEKPKAK